MKIITWTSKIIESTRQWVLVPYRLHTNLMEVEINMKMKRVIALDILIQDKTNFNWILNIKIKFKEMCSKINLKELIHHILVQNITLWVANQ